MDVTPERNENYLKKAYDSSEPLSLANFESEMDALFFVNWCLFRAYNDEGILLWWNRPRTKLDGRTPMEAWVDTPEKVIGLAGWLVNASLKVAD